MRSSGIAVLAVAALVTAYGSGGIGRSPTAGATFAARTVANFISRSRICRKVRRSRQLAVG
jgi:hypothetical protein